MTGQSIADLRNFASNLGERRVDAACSGDASNIVSASRRAQFAPTGTSVPVLCSALTCV